MSDETKPQDSAAMPPASAVSRGSNGLVAYYVHGSEYDTGCEFEFVTLSREHAEASGGTVETLVRLTDEERAAVDDGIDSVSGDESLSPSQRREIATSLRGLLRRLG
jgi:hypothetical protein